jgi:hypothetical protein
MYAIAMGGLLFMLLGPLAAHGVQAAGVAAGTYRCASYNVSGRGGSCRTFQPLILRADGTYQYSSTRGSWSVPDGRLQLSESRLWGSGEILGGDTLRFEYDYKGWRHTVTWVCAECGQQSAVRAPSTARASSAGGRSVGVTLTLEFAERIGGVSGFVIVPADAARRYTHNAPLPEGAVQGVAWETSATAIGLATGRNKLPTGRKYAVFLSWPRESIPVAVLDLPRVSTDYATTLRATLDGNAVLASLGVAQAAPPTSAKPPAPASPATAAQPAAPAPYPARAAYPTAAPSGANAFASDLLPYPGTSTPAASSSLPYPGDTSTTPSTAPASGPLPYPSATSPTPSAPSYPAPSGTTPPAAVGAPSAGQAAPYKCHPLIPKYSQPGCVE